MANKSVVRIISFICVFMIIFLALPGFSHADTADIDEKVRTNFKKMKTSGGMVLCARNGEIVYEFCYGYADKIAKEKVTRDHYFRIASVSKLVSALSVMKLVESGSLDLDENIGTYLGDPSYFAANPYYPKIPLTLRHLMTHTSSLKSSSGYTKHRELSLMLNVKNKRKSDFYKEKPGSVYRYSNFGAGIMGSIIESVTGMRLDAAAKDLIFVPMGIDAGYHPSQLVNPEKIVTTYEPNGSIGITRSYRLKESYQADIDLEHDYFEVAGSVWMTGPDLCKIGIMLSQYGQFEGKQILSEDTVREMLSSQKGKGYVLIDSPYGLNIERVTNLINGRMLYGHQGLSDGILCNLYFDPDSDFVFVLVTNGCNSTKKDHIGSLTRMQFTLMWDLFGPDSDF